MFNIKATLSVLMAISLPIFSVPTQAADIAERPIYGTGLAPNSIEEYERNANRSDDDWPYENVTVLSSIDLSTDGYFPAIGNQGNINSCTSWAITYYQFTHEAHKLNNITTTSQNAYSPRWTYNFLNGGYNNITSAWATYSVLSKQGAVTLGDYPYNVSSTVFYNWLNNEAAMLNALSTKVVDYDEVTISGGSTVARITSPTDSDLTEVKQLLCAGKIVTVPTRVTGNASNYSIKYTTNGDKAVYRAAEGDDAHLMTIVGYNDSVKCDINNDGIIQECEKGAFKVANSWGTSFGNNGYIWVMYDALNKVSANTINNWEASEAGTRKLIFDSVGYNYNQFYYMEVANQTVNLAGVINYNTVNTNTINFKTKRGTTLSSAITYTVLNQNSTSVARPYNGAFVMDFGNLDDDIINYLSGYKWYASIENNSGNPMQNISYKIVDNKDNTVKNAGVVAYSLGANGDYPITLNMQLGDVNYSGSITGDDQNLVLQFVVGSSDPSHLQSVLADYNQDGVINIMDVIAIGHASNRLGNGLSEEIDMNLIAELYRKYAEVNGLSQEFDIYEMMGLETK